MERADDHMPRCCEEDVPHSGEHTSEPRDGWSPVYATGYQLHHLLCANLHNATFGKSSTWGFPTIFSQLQASITSPDPELNSEARDYFARHMRILEQCTPHWPMPEVHAQINGLREAFSADTSQPFELKPSFPFGSPSSQHIPSPLTDGAYHSRASNEAAPLDPANHVNYTVVQPITPPVSTTDEIPKADSPVGQSLAMMAPQDHTPQPSVQHQEGFQGQWNPTKIFE
jgi:hypothetical protein